MATRTVNHHTCILKFALLIRALQIPNTHCMTELVPVACLEAITASSTQVAFDASSTPRDPEDLSTGAIGVPEDVSLIRERADYRQIGGYTITSALGSGGMAHVYRAIQQTTRKTGALKGLDPSHALG